MLLDLHTHTYPSSDDSSLGLEELAERAREAGLDGICITDHDRFWDTAQLYEVSRRLAFTIIPGAEITTEEGHLLVFGLDRYVFGMHRARFVRRLVEDRGGAIVVAHPYRRVYREGTTPGSAEYRSLVEEASRNGALGLADAVEVLNGRGSSDENAFAAAVAQHLDMPGTGASDSHDPEDVGTCATEFSRPVRSLEDLVRELKAGRFRPVRLR